MAKKILVIDDEHQLVKMLKIRFEAEGYEVLAAHDGKEGIKKVEDCRPDLIILDIIMPKMDGYTALRELRRKSREEGLALAPVLVMTAKEELRDLFTLEGVEDYVVKPFESDDLLYRVKKALHTIR